MIGVLGSSLAAGAALGAVSLVARGIFAPRSRIMAPVIVRGDVGGPPRVALTFDDGPWPGSTEAILEILAAERVPAAFFVIGVHARRWPELLRRIDREGHIVGNHSDTHWHWGASRHWAYWGQELDRTADAVADAIGRRPALFRPPLGHKTWFMARAARARGYAMVNWTLRARDGVTTTPERIVKRLVPPAAPGDIIVMHDGVDPHRLRDPRATVSALKTVIHGLRELGLGFERLDRFIGKPAYLGQAPAVSQRLGGDPANSDAAATG